MSFLLEYPRCITRYGSYLAVQPSIQVHTFFFLKLSKYTLEMDMHTSSCHMTFSVHNHKSTMTRICARSKCDGNLVLLAHLKMAQTLLVSYVRCFPLAATHNYSNCPGIALKPNPFGPTVPVHLHLSHRNLLTN
jgi:hypothetical protein